MAAPPPPPPAKPVAQQFQSGQTFQHSRYDHATDYAVQIHERRGLLICPDRRNFIQSMPSESAMKVTGNSVPSVDTRKRYAYTFQSDQWRGQHQSQAHYQPHTTQQQNVPPLRSNRPYEGERGIYNADQYERRREDPYQRYPQGQEYRAPPPANYPNQRDNRFRNQPEYHGDSRPTYSRTPTRNYEQENIRDPRRTDYGEEPYQRYDSRGRQMTPRGSRNY